MLPPRPASMVAFTLLAFGLACASGKDVELEGDDAGECSDAADNDVNGLFDCDDPGCAGSPACDEDGDPSPGDTGGEDTGPDVYTGATQIDDVEVDCDSDRWWADVYTRGRVQDAILVVAVDNLFGVYVEEQHPFPTTTPNSGGATRGTHDPNGYWDNPYMELDVVDRPGDAHEGESTYIPCGQFDALLTWAVQVTADSGVDCVTWGSNTNLSEGFDFSACDAI